jgi:hypothetical protein
LTHYGDGSFNNSRTRHHLNRHMDLPDETGQNAFKFSGAGQVRPPPEGYRRISRWVWCSRARSAGRLVEARIAEA